MTAATLTRTVTDEVFLGPIHTYAILTEVDEHTSRSEEFTRNVEGWFRTVETQSPATGFLWRPEVDGAKSRIGAVIDAVAHDREMLNQVVSTELHFLPAHADRTRRRKALDVALAKHGLRLP